MTDLRALGEKYLSMIARASNEEEVEATRLAALGKRGEISAHLRQLGKMSPDERKIAAPKLNALKNEVGAAIAAKKKLLDDAALDEALKREWVDITLPGRARRKGSIHPVSQVTEEVSAILADMGFEIAEGPQVESDWYNFDALNIPPEHPARQEHDTFFLKRRRESEPSLRYCGRTRLRSKSGQ